MKKFFFRVFSFFIIIILVSCSSHGLPLSLEGVWMRRVDEQNIFYIKIENDVLYGYVGTTSQNGLISWKYISSIISWHFSDCYQMFYDFHVSTSDKPYILFMNDFEYNSLKTNKRRLDYCIACDVLQLGDKVFNRCK